MEGAYVELGSERRSGAVPQFEDFELAHFVAERLAGHDDVAVDFGLDGRLVVGRMRMEVVHHLLPGPMLPMDAGVHHQPDGSKHVTAEAAIVTIGVSIQPNLLPETLRIQRPALYEGCVVDGFAEEGREAGELWGQ